MRRLLLPLVLLVALTTCACGENSPTAPTVSPSASAGSSTTRSASHNAGRDCTGCHAFTVAGTAYRSDGTSVYAGAVVRITTGPEGGGTLVTTLTADTSGNFYTNVPVSFGSGLYAAVTGTTGTVRSMSGAISNGACNRCHVSGNRVLVN